MSPLDPDHAEEELSSVLDNAIPTRGYQMLPTVGIGGSAGSIQALQALFSTMPADSGMAFVVILHLDLHHESLLAELLQRVTPMPVVQVRATARIEPNHVYVIPPGHALVAMGTELRLAELVVKGGRHMAVDLFFRTLADTYGPHATAIVLSGADGDGAIGIRRIKERGGLTIAQDPREAEHGAMPHAAIATGMVDWVLPVAAMGDRLVAYQRLESELRLPLEDESPHAEGAAASPDELALRDALRLLQRKTGHDFGRYSRATLVRRIARRMQINGIDAMPGYFARLEGDAAEVDALRKDILVSVTNFFRDAECFDALTAMLPTLLQDNGAAETVRVWVPACATGEEAYSIAILLSEWAHALRRPPKIQIFASDLDEQAIKAGREGVYPETIAADVSAERLGRWFTKDPRGYRIARELREVVLFAVHDLLTDAPFARLDLVSCRNLLIALGADARERALEMFHFGLRAGGALLLGAAEAVDPDDARYAAVDAAHRLYRKRASQVPALPPTIGVSPQVREALRAAIDPIDSVRRAGKGRRTPQSSFASLAPEHPSTSPGELHFHLIERYAAPSVLVDAAHNVIHMSQRAGRFLRFGGGEPSRDLLRLAHPMLQIELRGALEAAALSAEPVQVLGMPVEIDGQTIKVDIGVSSADEIAPGHFLVVFAEPPAEGAADAPAVAAPAVDGRAVELDRELDRLKAHLRQTVERHEVSVEELRASNEELLAMNEELRSATEELETSREELQAINEELSTVNAELKGKVDEIRNANSDLHNLMASIAVATVFLDSTLRVTLYTPSAVTLFNLIPGDIGRPFADLAQRLNYPKLQDDARDVVRTLVPVVREVADTRGRWFLARIQPYRTVDDRIAGVVLTFADITERKQAELDLIASRAELQVQVRWFDAMLSALPESVYTVDRDKRFVYANRGVERFCGRSVRELAGRTLAEAGFPDEVARRLEARIQGVLDTRTAMARVETDAGDGTAHGAFDYYYAPVLGAGGAVEAVVGWMRAPGRS